MGTNKVDGCDLNVVLLAERSYTAGEHVADLCVYAGNEGGLALGFA
jgi:hypothetical protein